MALEIKEVVPSQYVGFFTKHTQTYYEPFVETVYDNTIRDDRKNFYKGKINRLYFYTNLGGEPTNLDNKPIPNHIDGIKTNTRSSRSTIEFTISQRSGSLQ